jgi:hypothetical protein
MKKFNKDLKQGEKGELVIGEYLEEHYKMNVLEYNKDYKYDIKTEKNGKIYTFEIKTDRYEYFHKYKTFNMFIEYSCSKKDSGIYRTEADYFIYYYPDLEMFYFIEVKKLRELLDTLQLKVISQAGDEGRVTGVCLHRNLYKKHFIIKEIKKDTSIWVD